MIAGVASISLMATAAAAQDQPGDESAVAEIVVTGSRIAQPNYDSISPIQTVGSQEVTLGGRPQTIDILNQLPQVTAQPGVDLGDS
jgi:outer membrane cobalamin receptor